MPPTTPAPQISLPSIASLNITSPTAIQEQLRDLASRLKIIEDALEHPLHLDARLLKLERIVEGLKEGGEKDEDRDGKLDNAAPKTASGIVRISGDVDELKAAIETLRKQLRKGNVKEGDGEVEKDENEENKKGGDAEEDDSFASASEVATDNGIKKDEKLKHMDHGGRTDRVVRTVFEELDDGEYVEYKKISQELRKDLG